MIDEEPLMVLHERERVAINKVQALLSHYYSFGTSRYTKLIAALVYYAYLLIMLCILQ